MAREQGTFDFSANFEVKKAGTIDARQTVENFSDLLNFTADDYLTNGFPISVQGKNNPEECGLYVCKDVENLGLAESWEQVGKGANEILIGGNPFFYRPLPNNNTGKLMQGEPAKNGWVADGQIWKWVDKMVFTGQNGTNLNESTINDWKITT